MTSRLDAAAAVERPSPAPAPAGAPVLLTMADYYGTLAAVRALGRAGLSVTVADPHLLAAARWSRFAARTLRCPSVDGEPERFMEWLLEFGAREPGHVLFATSDDLVYLLALHRRDLERWFILDVPEIGPAYTLLNKVLLGRACAEVGVAVPETWLPRDEADLGRLAHGARFPLLIKPQTQVLLSPHLKGRVAHTGEDLIEQYRIFRAATRHSPLLLEHDRDASLPLVQSLAAGAADGIYGLSGYVAEDVSHTVMLASRKLLQRPRTLGVGLCFEECEVLPELAARTARLCRHLGYRGVFEVEFVEVDGEHQLIDFNPRFYGQIAFDVDRGIDLPLVAYLEAVGQADGARAALRRARDEVRHDAGRVYCNRIQAEFFLRVQRLTGRADRGEVRRWRSWFTEHRDATTDAVLARDDWMPGIIEMLSTLRQHLLHPAAAAGVAREH